MLCDRVTRVELAVGTVHAKSAPLSERVAQIQAQLSSLPFATASYVAAVESLRRTERAAVQSVAAPDVAAQATLLSAALSDARAWATHADTIVACQAFVNDEALGCLAATDSSALAANDAVLVDLQAEVAAQSAALDQLLLSHAASTDAVTEQFFRLDREIGILEREAVVRRQKKPEEGEV
jgi:hypothetical protein